MAIINVTPDSFSDGGNFLSVTDALRQAERVIEEGADIIDIGGESTRPKSTRVSAEEETARVAPVVEEVAKRFDIPISVDTTRADVAARAIDSGAEIVNDISGLRFDKRLASVAAGAGVGLILMHSRGVFEEMHSQPPVDDIVGEVCTGLGQSLSKAADSGVNVENIVLDVGIGFGKTGVQNLEVLANLDKIIQKLPEHPFMVGASRKSFIGWVTGEDRPADRLAGSISATAIAVWNGAGLIRAHDVGATVQTVLFAKAARAASH